MKTNKQIKKSICEFTALTFSGELGLKPIPTSEKLNLKLKLSNKKKVEKKVLDIKKSYSRSH